MERTIRKAEAKDTKKLESFLLEANLNAEGIQDSIDYYSLLETKTGELKACVGIEPQGTVGMLRSFVVSQGTTQSEIVLLFDRVISIAENKKLKAVYLVTNKESAVTFFRGFGFQAVDDVPPEIRGNHHLHQVLNVDNSIIMELPM